MLRRFTSKAVLCYDADRAGQTAAERSSELLVSEGFDVNVVQLPGGEDPDTFIQKQGRDGFVAQLKRSRPYLEFLLDRAAAEHDLARDDSRREFLRRMLGVAARIPDPAVRDQFADRLAHKARVTEDVVRAEIRKAAGARKTELPAERVRSLQGHLRKAEEGLIWTLVHEPAAAVTALRQMEPQDLKGLMAENILLTARDLEISPEDVPSALMERLSTAGSPIIGFRGRPTFSAGNSSRTLRRSPEVREAPTRICRSPAGIESPPGTWRNRPNFANHIAAKARAQSGLGRH